MSLGCQIYQRSFFWPRAQLLVAPRDPRLFSSCQVRTSEATAAAVQAPKHSDLSASSSPNILGNVTSALRKSTTQETPPQNVQSTVEPFDRRRMETIMRPVDEPVEELQVQVNSAFRKVLPKVKEAQAHIATSHTRPNFKRKIRVTTHRRLVHKDDKAFARSCLKDKGLSSIDWRVPLEILERNYTKPNPELFLSPKSLWRSIKSSKAIHRQIRADQIPRPREWTALSFASHVEDIVTSKVTRTMHRQLYAKGAGHVSEVAKTLNQLFHDPSVSSVLTPQAFCIAIAFFTRHCMISAVRNLIVRMNELSVKAEPEIFDLMLMGAASQRDLHNFTFLLKEMIRQGMVPTADTWSALTLAVDSEAAKLVIIRKMQQRKLITKLPTIRFVVSQLITMEVLSHIRSGRILVSFLNSMDLKYGEHWLSVGAGNKIIDTLCAHGMLSEAIEMLYLMKDRGQNPNQGSLIILLSQYARLRDEEGVLSVLRLFQFEFSLRPSQDAYDVMFITAWRHRSFNCCKTIWKYACVKSAVSHRMQRLVFTTLVRNTPEKPKTKTLKWYKTAGKVIIGIGLQADGRREALSGKNLWDQLGTWSETGNTRSESLITASGLLALELEASITFRPKLDFLELFEEALTMDRIWTKENTLMEKHVKWMVSNAVRIDFRPRR